MSEALIAIEDLKVHFQAGSPGRLDRFVGQAAPKVIRAIDGLSLDIWPGETLGLVGESGCGKSTLGRAILQLVPATAGRISYRGTDLTTLSAARLRSVRRHLQMVFQDPYASLNPRLTAGSIIAEPIRLFEPMPRPALDRRVQELMQTVGLNPAFIRRYPHEFSGGQRQRIGIARALAGRPEFIVADEPIAALDVSIQAQILNLLAQLRRDLGLTTLFISHDLRAVRHISDRTAVMYLGKLVEIAPSRDIYRRPLHPYTQALISAVPVPDPTIERTRRRIVLAGDVPSPINPPAGCRFHTRCPCVMDRCRSEEPALIDAGDGHKAACFLLESPQHGRVPPPETRAVGG
ncbi:oligopeptide/dipeptide ABC transporter, ATPase subunit [Gloeobacter kilaueensis JS1]|uniref:Oligopeptide/dipeptide ABC transporter, ATPase subunit n=1 Tax=Gloeobacter kilaueensis (strain ATCC BAA-2537 / CCAP 1431/1 / ULC 316 / JS1) TaxID=1183438 RepID=U5QEJ8_GLOK1|nr:oligopeptide/dipeptide ABC transporter ATP-binding protein [Gloeobacter kilaueensis]AGY57367.1 oligopeptide/dipeptide ABC transporter, ATPase subunit [Gloeobacter kilaueensis JS1]